MTVSVRFYGIVGDLAKRTQAEIELPADANVGILLDQLAGEYSSFAPLVKQVRVVVNGHATTRETAVTAGDEVVIMRAIGGGGSVSSGAIVHAELPIVPSPSGLPSQHIVTEAVGSTSIFVGQQWLQPGDRVRRHTHPVEEALTFLRGSGEAEFNGQVVPFGAGTSLFFPAGVPHAFRNTGNEELHVMIVFPCPHFAETTLLE